MTLTLGYESNKKNRGWIFVDGIHFANFYTMADDWPHAGKIIFNRDALALEAKIPVAPYFESTNEMMVWLEEEMGRLGKSATYSPV
jgi:hypothetical protein